MAIKILYFGVLKQRLGTAEEALPWQGGSGSDLLEILRARGGEWSDALGEGRVFRIAVNRQISPWSAGIPDGAEVGLLPPVTGG